IHVAHHVGLAQVGGLGGDDRGVDLHEVADLDAGGARNNHLRPGAGNTGRAGGRAVRRGNGGGEGASANELNRGATHVEADARTGDDGAEVDGPVDRVGAP